MTEAEQTEQLLQFSREIAAVGNSVWQPGCIARAYASRRGAQLAFTMQSWIDLDAALSPLLEGHLPGTEREIDEAFAAFGMDASKVNGEEAARVCLGMQREIREAFSIALPMQPADAKQDQDPIARDGFGSWLPIFACLVTQCGLSPDTAREMRVAQAYALIAAMRRNQGWEPIGTPYALRDLEENDASEKAAAETGGTD